ncbi:hypothetical protein GCM10022221_45340 [Actinocorallia aurea]
MPSASTSDRSAREAKAREAFAAFEKANNAANAAVSDELMSEIETGPVLEADLATNANIRAGRDEEVPEFFYPDPVFYVPAGSGEPEWFIVDALLQDRHKALVFVRDGEAYKLRNTVYFPKDASMPEAALSEGLEAMAAESPIKAADLSREHAALLNAAGGEASARFAPGVYTTEFFTAYCTGDAHQQFTGYGFVGGCDWEARSGDADFALRTSDGRALVFYTVGLTDSYRRGSNKDTRFDNVYLPDWYNPFVPVDKDTYSYSTEGQPGSILRHFYKQGYTGKAVFQFAALVSADGASVEVIADNEHPLAASGK